MLTIHALDTEASALQNGYPIQVGVVKDNGEEFCMLIKPHEEWLTDLYWDFNSECIHNIEQSTLLKKGKEVLEVAEKLNSFLGNDTVWVDSPYDIMWMNTLYEYAEIKMSFKINHIFSMCPEEFGYHWEAIFYKTQKETGLTLHNALDDAKMIQKTFETIAKHVY